ncbi:MAG: beta-1,4-galactosyltransferase [Chloroflexi bacterium]|nr:beta-1,4-galactosyltransferase [Chloroflexota bacterium]
MIFATVGTHSAGFDRLVTAVDELAASWNEDIIIQLGSSKIVPKHATHFQWATSEQMEQLTKEARVVITHAAAGAIILGLQKQTPLIVVPRLHKYGEHIDDHQLQLAEALSNQGRAIAVNHVTGISLRHALVQIDATQQGSFDNSQLVNALQHQLTQWDLQPNGIIMNCE